MDRQCFGTKRHYLRAAKARTKRGGIREGKCGDKLGRAKTLAERWVEVSLGWAERWVGLVDVLASAKVLG